MKKKYREIEVDGVSYAWSASAVADECEIPCVRVKIWRGKNTLIFDEVCGHQIVKPSMIACEIKRLVMEYPKEISTHEMGRAGVAIEAAAHERALEMIEWLWANCKIVHWIHPNECGDYPYPIEHNPFAGKECRDFIEAAFSKHKAEADRSGDTR